MNISDGTTLKPVKSPYQDLEERAFQFARETRSFLKSIPKTIINIDDIKQLLRSSGSIGANYIEANESLGEKDFLMKIRTARREAKESSYWLRLIETSDTQLEERRRELIREAHEFLLILSTIIKNRESNASGI